MYDLFTNYHITHKLLTQRTMNRFKSGPFWNLLVAILSLLLLLLLLLYSLL